ncbi:MAG: type IV pilus assembly protein PilM [Patescibacteria group bacterium]|nr:type IV pilus assembly protein PilM [Patescibacteria group bacterium]
MFDLLNLNPSTFGLDISDMSLKVIKIKKQKNQLRIGAMNEISLPAGVIEHGEIKNEKKLAEAIQRLVDKTPGLDTKHVVVSLPEEKTFVSLIEMPKMSDEEIKGAVCFEAENYIPFSVEKVYLDSQIIKRSDNSLNHVEVLLAALSKKTVDSYVSAIYRAGLIPTSMETESQATVRALIKGQKTKKPIFIIDIGATCSNFSVYFRDSMRFTSFIPFSSNKLNIAIAEDMKIKKSKAEKLKTSYGFQQTGARAKKLFKIMLPILTEFSWEIKKHIDYYGIHAKHEKFLNNGKETKNIVICGGGANLRGLTKFLSQETGLIVQKGNPLINLPIEDKEIKNLLKRKKLLSYTTAIGLALGDVL